MPGSSNVDRLLARIGLDGLPAPDLDGLRELHRAYVGAVPYEALAVQLGESEPLDADRLVAHVLHGGRGGYCFEVNTVLHALLVAAGFSVRRHQAHVNASELTNHMALVVDLGDERWLADAGLGEGPLDPVPLADGAVTPGPLPWTVERLEHGWCVREHEFGSITDFVFADQPSDLAAFQPHHQRLSRSPDSSFMRTLVVQRPHADRIVTLRSRTLFVDGPGRKEREVLPDAPAFASVLDGEFGIDPESLGAERLARLWSHACAQHEAFVAH
jgi:N-hydroxyarylamine O-acetyltransferase